MNKETIAGDIRRIRAILKPDCDGFVRANYCDLLKLFDAIETKAQEKDEEIADYKKRVAVYEEVVIENGGRIGRYDEAIRNLINALENEKKKQPNALLPLAVEQECDRLIRAIYRDAILHNPTTVQVEVVK